MDLGIDAGNLEGLVARLGDPVRARQAFWLLVGAGPEARQALRAGLASASGDVRMWCVRALDRVVDEHAWPVVIALLSDPDPRVRVHALHAVACDRCKQDGCRPAKDDVLPPAIRRLREDPCDPVRAMAVEVVGRWVHADPEAARALEEARDGDPAPGVRKKAGWYAPGGTIFRKSAPRRSGRDPGRSSRAAQQAPPAGGSCPSRRLRCRR